VNIKIANFETVSFTFVKLFFLFLFFNKKCYLTFLLFFVGSIEMINFDNHGKFCNVFSCETENFFIFFCKKRYLTTFLLFFVGSSILELWNETVSFATFCFVVKQKNFFLFEKCYTNVSLICSFVDTLQIFSDTSYVVRFWSFEMNFESLSFFFGF
jgi:hypothetical protein